MHRRTPWTKTRIMFAAAALLAWIATFIGVDQLLSTIAYSHNTSDISGLTSTAGFFGIFIVLIWLTPCAIVALFMTAIYFKETSMLKNKANSQIKTSRK